MKKTLLFCLILLAWNLNSFAEKGYVYERITSMDDIAVNTNYVVAIEEIPCLGGCYAITKENDNSMTMTDVSDRVGALYLTNIPENMVIQLSGKSGDSYDFKIGNTGFNFASSSVKWSTVTSRVMISKRSSSSNAFRLQQTGSTYILVKNNWKVYSLSSMGTDQSTYGATIEYLFSKSLWPDGWSFFIQKEAQAIILNDTAHNTTTTHYGVANHLPDGTKNGKRLLYWTDGEGHYKPGETYPSIGYHNGDSPITLYPVYRNYEEHWEHMTNWADLEEGDTIAMAIEDGGDGNNSYGIHWDGTNFSIKAMNPSSIADEFKFTVTNPILTNEEASFYLRSLEGWYVYNMFKYISAEKATRTRLTPATPGYFIMPIGSTKFLGVEKDLSKLDQTLMYFEDQHAEHHNLADITKTAAYAWTIYRKVRCYYGTATFNVRDDQGFPVAAQSGKTITFPSADAKFGWSFVGWAKQPNGPIYRKAGETAYLSGDQTFYAVYEPTVFLTLNLNNHGHWETEDRQNDSIMGGPSHILPAPNGDFSYGFMGWAKTPTATTPQYFAGETYAITEDETLYAVYKDTHIFRPIHSLDDIQDGDKVVIVLESGAGDNARIALEHSPLTTGSSMTVDTMSLTSYLIDKEALLHPNENVVFDFYKDDNNKWLFGVDRIGQTSKFYVRYKDPASTTAAKKIDLINASNSATDRQWTPIWRETSHRIYLKNGDAYYMTWTVATPSYFSGTTSTVIDNPSNSNQKICDQIAWWKNLSAKARVGNYDRLQAAITLYKAVPNDTLFYDAHGGTIEGNITQSIGGTLFLPVASKNGFVFKGWSDGEHLYKAGTCYPVSGNMNGNTTLTAEFVVTRNSFECISSLTQLQDGDTIIMTFEDGVGRGTDAFKEYGIVMENCTTKVINETNIANTDKINLDATYKWVITNAYNGTYRLYNAASKAFFSIRSAGFNFKTHMYYTTPNNTQGSYLDEKIDSVQVGLSHWQNNSTPVKLSLISSKAFFAYSDPYYATNPESHCCVIGDTHTKNQWADGKTLDAYPGTTTSFDKPAAITIYRMKQDPLCHYVFNAGEHGTCAISYINDDQTITLPDVTPYSGYEFTGWSDGANIYHAGDSYPYTGKSEIIFTAQYTILPLIINENNFDATILVNYHQSQINVSLTRQLAINSLNTFAVPFDMNASEIETTFGAGTELYAMSTVQVENGILTIFFEDASAIAAGTPYLMRPTKNDMPAVIELSSRTIDNTLRPVSSNGITFHPVFSPTVLNADGKTLFLSTGDLLYRPITTGSMKGLRAYFTQDEVTSAPIRYMIGRPHGIVTDWEEVNGENQLIKFIHNGQLLIRKNGKLYNALGAEIR